MVFIETSIFTKLLSKYMKDDEYRLFQLYLMNNPDKGDLIKGCGGVRKIRWAINNKGKSGGIRVIYYWRDKASETWLLTEILIKSNYFKLAKTADIFHKVRRNRATITSHFVKNSDSFFCA